MVISDYKHYPQTFKTHTVLSTFGLLKACKQAENHCREGTNVARLDIQPETEDAIQLQLELTAVSEQLALLKYRWCLCDGNPLLVASMCAFYAKCSRSLKAKCDLETNAANTRGFIRPVGDDSFKAYQSCRCTFLILFYVNEGWQCVASFFSLNTR